MFIDYETLKLIWWLFVGVLLIGFALLDGFDLGVGTLLPFVGRTDEQRRVILNAIVDFFIQYPEASPHEIHITLIDEPSVRIFADEFRRRWPRSVSHT